DAGARARGRMVRVHAVSLGGDGWRRVRPRRGAANLVDGISAHARRSRAGRAPRPGPAGRERSAARGNRHGGRRGGAGGARGGLPMTREQLLALRWPARFAAWALGSGTFGRALAAARLRGRRGRAYLPMLVLFAYAALVYQAPTSVAALAFGPLGEGAGSQLANAVSLAMLAWFAFVVYRGIEQHYGVSGERAMS